jgi:hypothetical protein
LISIESIAQTTTQLGQDLNAISTGVPFLVIAPDARAGAMGDLGAATSPDPNSIHWNPAKYAFIDQNLALNVSYIPWLRELVNDINFSNISGSYRIDENQVIGFSLMYFSLGDITFTNISGDPIGDFNPNEFSIDAAYALKLHKNLSGGIGLRYVHSNLTGGIAPLGSEPTHPGNGVAADISVFWTKNLSISEKSSNLSFGLDISNLGTKISYSDDTYQEFMPANLRIGTAFKFDLDDYNSLTFAIDINKLLVPTPPVYDSLGVTIIAGLDPNVSTSTAIFQSFYDAPGGFTEEMHELMYSFGMEYWYNKQFALRAGYFDEHSTKGNRKYFSLGLGVKLNVLSLDFAYLVPTAGRQNPLANTLRFTIGFNLKKANDK